MDLAALREATRSMLDDTVAPYLWPSEDIDRWLNNAVREACIRARLLKSDADTRPDLCLIPIKAGQALVTLNPAILVPQHGTMTGSPCKLWALSSESLDTLHPDWDNGAQTSAPPRYMVVDVAQKTLRLWPTPSDAGMLRLRVWRTPADDEHMDTDSDEPAIALPDPEDLKHWACFEAYLKQGAETYDTGKAQTQLSIFEARFGARPTFHDMARWADSPPRVRHAHTF